MKRKLLIIIGVVVLCIASFAATYMHIETKEGKLDIYAVDEVSEVTFFEESVIPQDTTPVLPSDTTSVDYAYVDLGLPSGTLWASFNVGANKPEESGDYFAWGETEPKEVYDWSTYKYATTKDGELDSLTKYNLNDGLTTLLPVDDAATANWGEEWRMPNYEEMKELCNECYMVCTYSYKDSKVSGVIFYKAKSANDKGKFILSTQTPSSAYSTSNDIHIFFPNAGLRDGADPFNAGKEGWYWSSLLYVENGTFEAAYDLNLYESNSFFYYDNSFRYYGLPVRAVRTQKKNTYVDLGLPSGTLWANWNVGATKPEEIGDYFAWGETEPKEVYDLSTYKYAGTSDGNYTRYNKSDGLSTLLSKDDAATANWGSDWCMPTIDEMKELIEYCDYKWTMVNGVYGAKYTGPNGNSVFFPAAGLRKGSEVRLVGKYGNYWSSLLYVNDENYACRYYFDESEAYLGNDGSSDRYYGFPVRAVRTQKAASYVDLGLPSGTLWATSNVGAAKPEEIGDYFAWGETKPKEEYKWNTYKYATSENGYADSLTKYYLGNHNKNVNLLSSDDVANVEWGSEWHMPFKEEMQELLSECYWFWTDSYNGSDVNGFIVYKAKEEVDKGKTTTPDGRYTSPQDYSITNDAHIFLPSSPKPGYSSIGAGFYWSRTLYSENEQDAYALGFAKELSDPNISYYARYNGMSVRAVCKQSNPGANHPYVDLGLPSGLLWATYNIGATKIEDQGDSFVWGETTPNESCSWDTYKDAVTNADGSLKYFELYRCVSGSIDNYSTLHPEDDAATVNMGNEWCMPTNDEMIELRNECYWVWTDSYNKSNVAGYIVYKAKKASDKGKRVDKGETPSSDYNTANSTHIFLPGIAERRNSLEYWSSSLFTDRETHAYELNSLNMSSVYTLGGPRHNGNPVRAVRTQKTHTYVDLGLPSNTLWANCNVGATKPEEYGDYFAWGETEPKKVYDMSTYKYATTKDGKEEMSNDSYSKYNKSDGLPTLLPEDDAATVNWGKEWRMPTHEEQKELVEKCDFKWTEVNGVLGVKIIGPNGNSVFFPAAGDSNGGNGHGDYWSSSLVVDYVYHAYKLNFNRSNGEEKHYDLLQTRASHGFSVRAVRTKK